MPTKSNARASKRKRRARNTWQETGIAITALGLFFLIVPLFAGPSPMLKVITDGLRMPSWLALGVGVLMLGIHHVVQKKASENELPLQTGSPRAARSIFHAKPAVRPEPGMAPARPNTPEVKWSPAVFPAIEWRRFEAVCEALFVQAGFETRSQLYGADGGVDIWLYSANTHEPVAVVQCKHWQSRAVGVKEIREFFGVMASHQLKHGTYATTSTYTADAQQFAKANGIHALDGAALLALIAECTPEQQQALLAVAFEGDYWRPTCASCGIKLVARTPSTGGAAFWGCSNFPRCKSHLPMSAALR